MSCDFEVIYNKLASPTNLQKGRLYCQLKKVLYSEVAETEEGTSYICQVVGSRMYRVTLQFGKDGQLLRTFCTCSDYELQNDICKHVVASALYCENKYGIPKNVQFLDIAPQVQNNFSVTSSETIKNLLAEYSFKPENINTVLGGKIMLLPCIENVEDSLEISLKIGTSKLYKIKNISSFVQTLNSNSNFRYGQKLEFVHQLDAFDHNSLALINILLRRMSPELSAYNKTIGIPSDIFSLKPSDLDDFFDAYNGSTIEDISYLNKNNNRVLFVESNPLITYSLTKSNNCVLLECLDDIKLWLGSRNCYIYDGKFCSRLDVKTTRAIKTFLAGTVDKCQKISLADMPDFVNKVLSKTQKYIHYKCYDVDLSEYEASELDVGLYLDTTDNQVITAELKCSYGTQIIDLSDTEPIVGVIRDTDREDRIKAQLTEIFGEVAGLMSIVGEEAIYNFVSQDIEELNKYMTLFISDALKKITVKRPNKLLMGVKVNSNLLELTIQDSDLTTEELLDAIKAYKRKKKFTRLKNGSYINLEGAGLDTVIELENGLGLEAKDIINNTATIPLYRAPFVDTILKNDVALEYERDEHFKELIKDIHNAVDATYSVPTALKPILRKYQKIGYRWLRTLCQYNFGGILADDMGLGKSLQIIALISSMRCNVPSLIICPTSLILNWKNEFIKFANDIKVLCVFGNAEERKQLLSDYADYDVIITSYELLRRDEEVYFDKEFLFHIVDEAQFIKNHNTKNARSVKYIKSRYRFALTGTPIENNLAELWSIFDFVMPGYLYSYGHFRSNYEQGIVKMDDADSADRLRKMVKPFILRRLKINVLKELPPKVESVVKASLEGKQKEIYLAYQRQTKETISQALEDKTYNKSKIDVLSMLTRLRQICCSPELIFDDYQDNSAKLEMCLDLLRTSIDGGHKVLLFSQFTSMLSIIADRLILEGISFFRLQGSTSKQDRINLVEQFNIDNTGVFLISLKAGGTGLNLTGADVVIHYDPWWNISAQNQATDRAYRIGQDKSVAVYKLIVEDTIEQKIVELQERKKELTDLIIQEGEEFVNKLDPMEIMSLFS